MLGWFAGLCRRLIGEFLVGEGFGEIEPLEPTAVTFVRGSRFIQFGYYAEDAPAYSVMVSLGFIRMSNDEARQYELDGIGLWRLIPEADPLRSYPKWKFEDEDEAANVLQRIRDELLPDFALPAIDAPERLSAAIHAAQGELEACRDAQASTRNLKAARQSFGTKDFRAALDQYSRVREDRLTEADRKRIQIAKRKRRQDE